MWVGKQLNGIRMNSSPVVFGLDVILNVKGVFEPVRNALPCMVYEFVPNRRGRTVKQVQFDTVNTLECR